MQSRSRSIKTLDHAMSGQAGTESCETFVEAMGLKYLFSALMGKVRSLTSSVTIPRHSLSFRFTTSYFLLRLFQASKKSKSSSTPASEDTTHILSILSSLFSNLPSDSPSRIRLLAKFVESNYEKTDKLLDVRESAHSRLKVVDKEIEAEKKVLKQEGEDVEEEEDVWYLRRLDGGLYTLQMVDYILAWVMMEDDGVGSLRALQSCLFVSHTDESDTLVISLS